MRYILSFIAFTVLALVSAPCAFAQWTVAGNSPWEAALAEANVAATFPASDALNPALIAGDSLFAITAAFNPDSRGLLGSSTSSLTISSPITTASSVGASAVRYSYHDIYSETSIGIVYSQSFMISETRAVYAAIRARYDDQSFGDRYDRNRATSVDLGLKFRTSENVSIGVSVDDVLMLGSSALSHPPQFDVGISYAPAIDFVLHCAGEFDPNHDLLLRIGAEYLFSKALRIGVGYESLTGSLSGGLDIAEGPFHIEASGVRHPELGYSLAFGVRYQK